MTVRRRPPRGSRLLVPLLFTGGLTLLYYFALNNVKWIENLGFEREPALRTFKFLAWIPAVFFIVRLVDLVIFDIFAGRRGKVRPPALLRELVSIGMAVVLFALVFSTVFHKSVTTFLATGTILAAILGFALQDTLGNLFAGIALHLEDSFEIGDVIRAGEYIGTVEAVRWRGARIRTFNNTIVIVPNSVLARDRVEVYPRNNLNARLLQLGIDFNVPPAKVIGVLTQAAANVDGVSREVPCLARVGGFAESTVTYEIKYFTEDYSQRDRIDAEIRKAAWYALRRNGIVIPYPVRSFQRYEAPQDRSQPEKREVVERLAGVTVLAPLNDEARETIAGSARVCTYSRGETIIRQGAAGDSMFIIHSGTVSARVPEHGEIAVLNAGDFFGEMALLTGESRTADVVAKTDVVAIEISKEILAPVLRDHPGLADAISSEVADRRAAAKAAALEDTAPGILSRIRLFFHL